MNIDKLENLADIIIKIKLGVANNKDRQILNDWINLNDANLNLYSTIMSGNFVASKFMMEEELEYTCDLNEVKSIIIARLKQRHSKYRLHKIKNGVIKLTAVIILFLGMSQIYSVINEEMLVSQSFTERDAKLLEILPLSNNDNIILITDNGDKINLRSEMDAVIINSSAKLDAKKKKKKEIAKNTIITPVGKSYNITLSDGTKVWLNENSQLKYAVDFGSNDRIVELIGEAYFEVTKSDSIPFFVKGLNNTMIKVLGTKFNVNSTKATTLTTLVEGSVEVGCKTTKITIKPSQQASTSKDNETIEVIEVDTDIFTAWKENRYIFKKEPIKNIINTISKWYNIDVEYDNDKISEIYFTGVFNKSDSLTEIIDIIEATKIINIKVKDDNILKLYMNR